MKTARIAVICVVCAAFAACSSNTPATTGSTPPASSPPAVSPSASNAVMVQMTDQFKFVPDTLTIATGKTVTWTNTGSIPHTVTACAATSGCTQQATIDTDVDSGNISAGQTFSHTFTTAGKFYYYCKVHGASMMHGLVIVT